MSLVATTKLSSKGQVVIPDEIRTLLKLESGAQFLVYAQGDTVFLKLVAAPSREDLSKLMTQARSAAKKAGLSSDGVEKEIKAVRKAKRKSGKQ